MSHDPGTPAYEAARSTIATTLREIGEREPRSGYSEAADDLTAGQLADLPSWVALQALAAEAERGQMLHKALSDLEKMASQVAKYGAQTGAQWPAMAVALIQARAALIRKARP